MDHSWYSSYHQQLLPVNIWRQSKVHFQWPAISRFKCIWLYCTFLVTSSHSVHCKCTLATCLILVDYEEWVRCPCISDPELRDSALVSWCGKWSSMCAHLYHTSVCVIVPSYMYSKAKGCTLHSGLTGGRQWMNFSAEGMALSQVVCVYMWPSVVYSGLAEGLLSWYELLIYWSYIHSKLEHLCGERTRSYSIDTDHHYLMRWFTTDDLYQISDDKINVAVHEMCTWQWTAVAWCVQHHLLPATRVG